MPNRSRPDYSSTSDSDRSYVCRKCDHRNCKNTESIKSCKKYNCCKRCEKNDNKPNINFVTNDIDDNKHKDCKSIIININ